MRSPNQSSNILTRKLKQFSCLHRWHRKHEVSITPFEGFLYEFECDVCNKKVHRTMLHAPMSGILPKNPWEEYKKDPLYNVSPPIINKDLMYPENHYCDCEAKYYRIHNNYLLASRHLFRFEF